MVEEVKMREGYKNTEVGVIPEDWEVKKLKDLSNMKSGQSITSKGINEFDKYPCYGGNGLRGYTYTYTHKGEFALIGRQGALCGNVQYVSGAFYASEHAVVVTPNIGTDIKWLSYKLIDMRLNQYSESSAQPGLSVKKISEFKVATPLIELEQEAIVTVLTDTDNLIQSLKKLIEKKKKIKQGTMQLLLTGKKRLPGFSGELIKLQLKDILELNKGSQLNRNTLSEKGDYPVINGGIEPSGYTSVWNCSEETITISEGGNSCGYVNFLRTKFWSGGHLYTVKLKYDTIYKQYLYYLLKFNEPKIMSLRVGSGLPNIQKKSIGEFQLNFMADYDEQKAIAQVLSDMDSEIEVLEQKLEKLKIIKQGMMQELLTGRIRLI